MQVEINFKVEKNTFMKNSFDDAFFHVLQQTRTA
jgi:hypothetical protein